MKRFILIGIILIQQLSWAQTQKAQLVEIPDIVKRVDYFVSVLHNFNDNHRDICRQCFKSIENILLSGENNQLFKDTCVKNTIFMMKQLNCIEPIFETWNSSKKNGYIQDQRFLQEFTQIIFVIYKEILPLVENEASYLKKK